MDVVPSPSDHNQATMALSVALRDSRQATETRGQGGRLLTSKLQFKVLRDVWRIIPLDRRLMGRDRRVAIDVITSAFRVIITTDTPERGSREISLNSFFIKSQFLQQT